MDAREHWQRLYETKAPRQTSWYQPRMKTSLDWIAAAVRSPSASIIDIGGGESPLIDDLLATGHRTLTVLDIAGAAIAKSQERLGPAARDVTWWTGDVTAFSLPVRAYDLWHDRAVFHFLTQPEQRAAYRARLTSAMREHGQVVMATFGPDGPKTCSGLDTVRYDAASLHRELGSDFQLVRSALVEHQTPFNTTQQFLYCQFSFASSKGFPS